MTPGFPTDDTDEVASSIRAFADRAPDFAVAVMGHGDPLVSGGADALRTLADRL